ncbi:PilT/PilU family type 4a pilus ATPase [bacterium]|jgi:twitching motility protein PilT|nr:PilT/PilU family type 4a pilus ATPase [bacterium]MBT6831681.1 PilT/PilU family type 4a pilus ATPase [bacterium]MBT6996327.1 PilT/PilU family type 4a pilus ATPase [bacterium]MBT7773005.1 PilT/PilU family type 4a pilus ATPase [bacterium]
MDFEKLVVGAVQSNASDIHLAVGMPPYFRISGQLQPVPQGEPLTNQQIQDLLMSILPERNKKQLQEQRQTDFVVKVQDKIRLRGNAFFEESGIAVSFRIIPQEIRKFETLGFPKFVFERMLKQKNGLILVVGPTGQGKSTTLASILKEKMEQKTEHIITIEDPIEYILKSKTSVVRQREVGRDVANFKDGIKAGLREDPDILMVGEMRDHETISSALTMAETGHVVYSTLHTNDGPQTVARIIDVFAPEQQEQVRSQLASTLSMIVSQRLVPTVDGKLTLAYEILTNNYAIQNHIRQNKIFQIPNVLQTDNSGEMVEFEQSLAGLVMAGRVSKEVAMDHANDAEQLKAILAANGVQ